MNQTSYIAVALATFVVLVCSDSTSPSLTPPHPVMMSSGVRCQNVTPNDVAARMAPIVSGNVQVH